MIIKIEKEYHNNTPSLHALSNHVSFYQKIADDFCEENGGYTNLSEEQREVLLEMNKKTNVTFDVYAPAKDLEQYIKYIKKNCKEHGFEKTQVLYSFFSKCHGLDTENNKFETDRLMNSTAMLNLPVSMKQLHKWANQAEISENTKKEFGVAEEVAHHISVFVAGDLITIWLN